jgi:pimeloyl-ACP methyl ester carboxylesterase
MSASSEAVALDESGSGQPLVLIHGLGTNRAIWDEAAAPLAREHRVIAIDLPGFGDSDPIGRGFDLEEVALRVADAVESHVENGYDLLGHSLGGAIALMLAGRRPESVRRLILSAPAGFRPRSRPVAEAVAATAPAVLRARRVIGGPLVGSRRMRRGLLWGALHDGARISRERARALLEASSEARRLRAATRAAITVDLADRLARAPVPVGLIWGTRDPLMRAETTDEIRRCRPEAPVELVPGAGHVAQLEKPELFARAVETVLARLVTVS